MSNTPVEKARKIVQLLASTRNPVNWSKMEFPDISCKKCGREIYCGVNLACSDPKCERKDKMKLYNPFA